MAGTPLGSLLRYIRGMVHAPGEGPDTDAQLLERFLGHQDETAFEALVGRHGPMVLGVGRAVLNDAHAAEDVFQATFLVLARKAEALRKHESVGSWLYGTAYRIALNARASAARRRKHERQVAPMPPQDPSPVEAAAELRPLLVEEMNRLPEKYRAPLVLCYLEGLTNEEAALQLRWPSGTVKGRLARAREMLRDRLARRGVTVSAGALAAALSVDAFAATVPPALLAHTVQAAMPVALGAAIPASLVSEPVAALARQALRQSLVGRIAAGLVIVAVLGGGTGLFLYRGLDSANPAPDKAAAAPAGPRVVAAFAAEEHYAGNPVPVAFSLDGKRLVVLAKRDAEPAELFLQDAGTGVIAQQLRVEDGFRTAAGDGKSLTLVYGTGFPPEGRAEVRDFATFRLTQALGSDKSRVLADEGFLAGTSLILIGSQAEEPPALPAGGGAVIGGGFGGAGPKVVAAADRTGKGKPVVHPLADGVTVRYAQVAGANTGAPLVVLVLASEDTHRLETLDPKSGKKSLLADGVEVLGLAASTGSKRIAVQTAENTVQLYEAGEKKTGRLFRDGDHTIACLALSPDGKILATAGSAGAVKLWNTATGALEQTLVQTRTQQLLFSPNGRMLAGASPEEVRIWHLTG